MTPGGIIPLWGRDHLGIGGRHHSVTRGDIIQELGGGFLRNQHRNREAVMIGYFVSLLTGLVVAYALVQVRSPAPPLDALLFVKRRFV